MQDNNSLRNKSVVTPQQKIISQENVQAKKRSLYSDIFVTILCLLGFYLSLQFFYFAVNRSLDKINETPIGTITFKYKTAQRKLLDRVLWDRVKQNSPVYNGDIVRTAELSEATITFIDGNIMNLYDQTLAQIFLDIETGAAVDFTEGGISLDTSGATSGITLTSGNATVQLETGASLNALASTSQDGITGGAPLSIQMTSGSASLVSEDGLDALSLTEGNALVLQEGQQSFSPPSITVLAPNVNEKYIKQTGDTLPVSFRWEAQNITQSDSIILETSRNRNFTQLSDQISLSNANGVTLNLEEGVWYWRIYVLGQNYSVSSRLQVFDSPLPQAIVPAENAEFTYSTKLPSVRFMWSDDTQALSWVLEVSDNAQMTNPVFSQSTNNPSSIVSSLESGTWYWQVRATYPSSIIRQLDETTSQVRSFSITEQGVLSPAELTLPARNGYIDTTRIRSGQYFSWKHDYEAAAYTIRISKNADLSNPTVQESVEDNYFVLNSSYASIDVGQWYWGVTKSDANGGISNQSEIRSFLAIEGEVEQRTVFPSDGYVLAQELVYDTPFTWRTNLEYAMKLEISRNANFSSIYTSREVNGSSFTGLNLPSGQWYWRINAIVPSGDFTFVSAPKSFTVRDYLDKVPMNEIGPNNSIVVRPGLSVDFTWESVEDADYYQFSLFSTFDRLNPIVEDPIVEGNSLNVNLQNLPEGNYVWSMRAMASETATSTRLRGVLTEKVLTVKKLTPISLVSPSGGEVIEGLDALLKPPVITWSSVEVPHDAVFILTQVNRGLTLASRTQGTQVRERDVYLQIENPERTIQLPSLGPGRWYWSVIAETDDGFDITAVQPASFFVEEIEPFPVPRGLQPSDNLLLNDNYFRQQRYIDFSWNSVNGADGYILQITDNRNRVLFEELFNEETSYRFTSFDLLDRGTYTWTVEAVLRLEDGTFVKRGRVSERDFRIDLSRPTAPQRQTTGELYGL